MVNYGTDANSLVEKSQPQASGDDFSALNLMFQVQVTGLSYSTVYYYQLVANNSFGHTSSPVMSFITPDLCKCVCVCACVCACVRACVHAMYP